MKIKTLTSILFLSILFSNAFADTITEPIRTFTGHNYYVSSVAFSPDGRYVLSGSFDGVKLWDMRNGAEILYFNKDNPFYSVGTVAFSPNGQYVLGIGVIGIKLWNVNNGTEIHSFNKELSLNRSLGALSPDGQYMVFGYDNALKLWDINNWVEIRSFGEFSYSMTFSPDSQYVLSNSYDNTLKLWNVSNGMEIRSFSGHESDSYVHSMAFSPNGQYILSISHDKVILWDVNNGTEIHSFNEFGNTLSVAFSPDGQYALFGYDTIKLWDVNNWREIRSFRDHNVMSVAFSPDGQYALSGSYDKTLKLWDTGLGSPSLPANVPPTAAFSISTTHGSAPLTISLDASSSTDSDGTIVNYAWTASDGQTASGKRMNMTFPNAGTYSISLVVTDDKGAQSTNPAQQTVTVTAKPVPKAHPIAHLSISPTNGTAPLTVSLNESGSSDPDGTIVEYAWTASDGQKALGANTQITFAKSGSYIIILTVTDNDGLTTTAQYTVTVSEPEPVIIDDPPPNPDSLGQAIIIAAGGAQPNNTLFKYSNDFTQRMYRLLKERGFTDADIHYMNPWQPDIDLDGYPDDNRQDYNLFDPEPELSAAFAQAAANLSAGQQFVFYLHGHARPDHFLITPSYELSASRLRDLLATLPAGVQQVIILDSCYSGSFADELAGVENRVVITSADESTLAWNTQFTSFADKFLRSLRHGETLRQAFIYTEDMILGEPKLFREQRPWLDDDGDGQYTSRDGTRAASIYLGQEGVHAAPPPKITLAHDSLDLIDNATSATLWVRTTPSQESIRKVQAVLINPNFAGSDYQGEATDFEREEKELIYNAAQDRHEIAYDGFWIAGTWRILYQAQNTEGVWSDIVSGEVQVSNIGCNPCVKMVLNQSRYTANEQLRLDMAINGNAELDLYVVILFPEGIFITITYPLNFNFPNAIQAYQTGVAITGEKRFPIIDFPLPANVGLGGYHACGVLTGTGNDPKNINDWLHWHCAVFEVY